MHEFSPIVSAQCVGTVIVVAGAIAMVAERNVHLRAPNQFMQSTYLGRSRQVPSVRFSPLDANEFEGGIVRDAKRSEDSTQTKRGGEPRRRFTIAHELGHLLMAHHVPDQSCRFICKKSDLLGFTAKGGDQRQRREIEEH